MGLSAFCLFMFVYTSTCHPIKSALNTATSQNNYRGNLI